MLTEVSHYVSEIVNMVPNPYQPYVGTSAFTHKGGLHVAAVLKTDVSYQHVPPETVGNTSRMLVSELGGSRAVQQKLQGESASSSSCRAMRRATCRSW